MMGYDIIDYMRQTRKVREERSKQIEKLGKDIKKIKSHRSTRLIRYPEYKEAFDYVDDLFPNSNIKYVGVYQVSGKFMEKLGYGFAGGFYERMSKIIVFSSSVENRVRDRHYRYQIITKVKKDEVIVHELIHYAYYKERGSINSQELNEEFAYGWSSGYLRAKGYSDEEIIKNNFMPFLISLVQSNVFFSILLENGIERRDYNSYGRGKKDRLLRRYRKQLHERSIKGAMLIGQRILDIYFKKLNSEKEYVRTNENITKFDLLDF